MKDWILLLIAFLAGAIIVYLVMKRDVANSNIQNVNYASPPSSSGAIPTAFVNDGRAYNIPDTSVYKMDSYTDSWK